MIHKSIRWQLQLWHGCLLVLLVGGLMSGFYTFERRSKMQAVDAELQEALTPLLPKLAPPGGRGEGERRRPPPEDEPRERQFGPSPENRDGERRIFLSEKFYFASWSAGGERAAISTNSPPNIPKPDLSPETENSLFRTRGELRELAHRVPSGTIVLIGTSLKPAGAELRKLAVTLIVSGFGIVVVGLGVGWWTAGRALKPIGEISRAAREISGSDLSKRINTTETESELGQLAAVLNSTFARLDAAFARQKQFTSDAAHELRTPVSVILTQTQSTLNRERPATEYRETLESCQRAAQRMRRLIESLLELARLDGEKISGRHEPVELARVVSDCAALVKPIADERRITLHTDCSPATCTGDADQLALVVTNLLTNAIHHNRDGGEVRISTAQQNGDAILSVADNGPGIPPEHLPHIFERFYRVDAARTTSAGRSGLGLAITKAIVDSHGGKIEVQSQPGKGSEFKISFKSAG